MMTMLMLMLMLMLVLMLMLMLMLMTTDVDVIQRERFLRGIDVLQFFSGCKDQCILNILNIIKHSEKWAVSCASLPFTIKDHECQHHHASNMHKDVGLSSIFTCASLSPKRFHGRTGLKNSAKTQGRNAARTGEMLVWTREKKLKYFQDVHSRGRVEGWKGSMNRALKNPKKWPFAAPQGSSGLRTCI